jgi:hypothetical protein
MRIEIVNFITLKSLTIVLLASMAVKASSIKENEETLFRQKIEQIEIDLYNRINKNWTYKDPNNGEEWSIDSKEWTIQPIHKYAKMLPGFQYQGENSVEAFMKALKKLPDTKTALECMRAMQIVQILTFWEVVGDECFKNLLKITSSDFTIFNGFNTPGYLITLAMHMNVMEGPFEGTQKKVGDFHYLHNIQDYFTFIKGGFNQGHNLVCVGDNKYMGFGDIFTKGPLSQEEIYDDFYLELQKHEKFLKKYKDKEEFLKELKKNKLSYTRFKYETLKTLLSKFSKE